MGTKLGAVFQPREIALSDLAHKRLAIDAFNNIYQYLSTIRQYDGTPLKDSKGHITSHLSGLFFRTSSLMGQGIKVAFVFDGQAPALKKKEQERRHSLKIEAKKKYDLAAEEGDYSSMKKYASRTSSLTQEMIEEAKELMKALGCPIIQAPSEGEAQAAHMVRKGDFYAVATQDTDALLFGSPRIVKNLTISQKKKVRSAYVAVRPEILDLSDVLAGLGLDIDQLIVLGILSGTDFNPGGIKGIGPKKGLKLIQKYGHEFDALFTAAGWKSDVSWREVFRTIKDIPVTEDYALEWGAPDREKVYSLLVRKHEFSEERVDNALNPIVKQQEQKGLDAWF